MAQAPKNTQGLPPGFKVYSPFPFAGIDLKSSPIAMDDKHFYYLENFLKLGEGYLRTAWDHGAAIFTPVPSIVSFAFYVIGESDYVAVFCSDGSAYQYAIGTGVVTLIGPATTFYQSSTKNIPCTTPWGSQFLLISNDNTPNDFWAWDGSLLYTAGSASPNGVTITGVGFDYTSVPTATAYGGEGSGIVLTPVVQGGEIVQVNIDNPGSGYEIGDNVQVAFSGGGSDTAAILEPYLNPGSVGAVTISSGGANYTSATVSFTGGGGTGAAGTVQISSGVTAVPVTAGGTGYTFAAISFSGGGGTLATAVATISGGVVTGVVVTNPGSGYTSAPTASITGTGTGATLGTVTIAGGVVSGVTITNGGTGYTSAPAVHFAGTGTAAAGTALLSPESVAGVNIVNGGTGYTSDPALTFVGGGGSGATGYALLTPTSIASIELTAGGSMYTLPPVVTFIGGNGTGAAASVIMNGESVGKIVLTNGGTGYTGNVQVLIQLSPAAIAFNSALSTSAGNPQGLSPITGSGAAAKVVYQPTSIGSVVMSNGGTFYTNAPSCQIAPGSNNAAYATITLMPYGVSGSCMETFLSRLFIGNPKEQPYAILPAGGDFQYSAAGGFVDFSTADGGGLFVNSDRFLKKQFVGIRQSNGYLYFLGDDSVSVLSNLQTTGTPTVTTFTYQNVDPQIGLAWRDSMQDFGRSVIFGNPTGVYGLYGGNVTKISADLDRLFSNAVFPPTVGAIKPCGACAHLFNVKHYMMLMTIADPDSGELRNVMVTWNEKDWVVTSQSVALTYIATQEVNSQLFAWGTDGISLYPLFSSPSASLTKRFDTKFYGADTQMLLKDLYSVQIVAQDQSANMAGVSGTLGAVASTAAVPVGLTARQEAMQPGMGGVIPQSQVTIGTLSFQAPSPTWPIWTSGTPGLSFNTIGFRFTSTAPDFVLGNIVIGYLSGPFAT